MKGGIRVKALWKHGVLAFSFAIFTCPYMEVIDMSKFLNTAFGIIGAGIVGFIIGVWTTFALVGNSMTKANEIEDEWIADTAKNIASQYNRLFYC